MLTLEIYNNIRGTHFAATEHNMALIAKLNALNVTEEEVRCYVMPAGSRQHEMRQMASDYAKARGGAPKIVRQADPTKAAPKRQEEPKMPNKVNATDADALIAALNSVLKAPALNKEEIETMVNKTVDEKLAGVAPMRIEVVTPKGVNKVEGVVHEAFETVLNEINGGDAVYLYGPAGTGKTHMAKQVADALGLPFHYTGQIIQPYELTGFTDANGRYQPTPWYHACTGGGIAMLDEFDRSNPEAVTKVNGALANGWFDFPAPIGTVKLHPDFRCIAAGNTFGRGANAIYTAANVLDASTLDRFLYEEVGYDKRIEDAIDKEAAEFVRVMRKSAGVAGLDIVLSYRAIKALHKYADKPAKVIKSAITAPLTKDDINILKRDPKMKELAAKGNKFAVAFAV